MFEGFREVLRLYKFGKRKRDWKKLHPMSDSIPMNDFDFSRVIIGNGSYGELNVVDFGGENKLVIKNYVSIAQQVTFVLSAEHYTNHISTYPFIVKTLHSASKESFGKGDILVDDDVWIGYGSTIMSGVHIGQGAVIAAGAVVTKDVPPYAVVGGVPAKIIKYRFNSELIEELMKIDYGKLAKEDVKNHVDDLYLELSNKNQLKWMPQKNS